MAIEGLLTFYLTGRVHREGDLFVAECVFLPVVSQGESPGEAIANLIEATQLFVESCIERGVLPQVLLKNHWRPMLRPPVDLTDDQITYPVPLPALISKMAECRI